MSQLTAAHLQKIAPGTSKQKRDRFVSYLNASMPNYGITQAPDVRCFLATICFESDYFKTCTEYASGWDYDITHNRDKAIELGNTKKGDGPRYKGSGLIQTTGKKNYISLTAGLGKPNGVDFVEHPELLRTDLHWAVESACYFWKKNKLSAYAMRGEFDAIQGIVNRGDAGKTAKAIKDRRAVYRAACQIIPDDFVLDSTDHPPAPANPILPDNPANPSVDAADEIHIDSAEKIEPAARLIGAESGETQTTTETILQKVERAGDRIKTVTEKTTDIQNSFLPVSKSSWFITASTKLGGWLLLAYAFAKDNWLELLIAFALIALAVWYFSKAKDRAVNKFLNRQ